MGFEKETDVADTECNFNLIHKMMLKITEQLNTLPDDEDFLEIENNEPTQSNSKNDEKEYKLTYSNDDELLSIQETNKSLMQEVKSNEKKIQNLSSNIDSTKSQLNKLDETLHHLRSIQDSSMSTSSLVSSLATSASLQQPRSLPNFGPTSNIPVESQENFLKYLELNINMLKQENIQLQVENRNHESAMKQLQEKERNLKRKKNQLNMLLINPDSESKVWFSPEQQSHVDAFRQRLEQEVKDLKEQLDATVAEAQSNINVAKHEQQLAENHRSSLRQQVEEAEAQVTATTAQMEELRTALVVATRVTPQSVSARNKNAMDSLRSMARQYEEQSKRKNVELQQARQEKARLEEQLQQATTSRPGRQTIINRFPGGGTTTIERNGGNVTITNEGVTISGVPPEDID